MRLGKKVKKVMRVGTKALAIAGAVGGAWLGVKNAQYHANQGARDEYHAGVEARDASHRKKDATAKSKAIMEKLDRDEEADKRHRASVISEASAKGKKRAPVPPRFGEYVVKTHKKKRGETAMERLHRINKMKRETQERDAVRDEKLRKDVGTRAKIAKAEEDLRIKKKKKKGRR
jgi:hypothetical protein